MRAGVLTMQGLGTGCVSGVGLVLGARLGDPEPALHLLSWGSQPWDVVLEGRKLRPQDPESGSLGEGERWGLRGGGRPYPFQDFKAAVLGV